MQLLFVLLILIYAIMAIFFAVKNNISMIKFFLCAVFFQNIICILFAQYVPGSFINIFSLIKEGMLYLAFMISMLGKRKIKYNIKISICLMIFMIILIKNFFITTASTYASIVALRFLLVPLICILIGSNLKISDQSLDNLCRFIIRYSVVLAISGVVELLLLNDSFWNLVAYDYYAINIKGNAPWTLRNGVTENFYTYDFGSNPIRRLVTLTADPLASAYVMFLGAITIYIGKIKHYSFLFLLLVTCSILVLSKAVFVFIPIVLLTIVYFQGKFPKWLIKVIISGCGIGGVAAAAWYVKKAEKVSSILIHILGLVNGFSVANFGGNGLGTAGVSSAMIAGSDIISAESYIGTLTAQMGILGTIFFIAYFALILQKMENLWKCYHNKFTLLSLTLLIGLIVCMLFSESSVSISGTGIYFILIGISLQSTIYCKTVIGEGKGYGSNCSKKYKVWRCRTLN